MKVLLVGSGAREHALAWRINQSPRLTRLWVADGNAGTASIATNLDVKPGDVEGLVAAAGTLDIDLVVVGPELPLSLGLVDQLTTRGVAAYFARSCFPSSAQAASTSPLEPSVG